MATQIYVVVRNVYGTNKIYPVCDTAKLLAQLTGKKTFSFDDIKTIAKLGYAVTQAADNVVGVDALITRVNQ